MAETQQYKCPSCGGAVEFDSSTQNLKCPYCNTEFDIASMSQAEEATSRVSAEDRMEAWNTELSEELNESEADGMCSYICESCGGEILGDKSMGATTCPFCGNNVVINEKFSSVLRPDLIIPFKLDKKAAKAALKSHLKDKKLLPKLFTAENHIDEIKGVYVPFWLFDAEVDGSVKFSATRVKRWSTSKHDYTQTSYYDIYREGSVAFGNIPTDASSKMPDDLMDSLEPFDLGEAVDFNTAYIAGYLADKYDVTVNSSLPRINVRVKNSTEEVFQSTVTGDYVSVIRDDSFIHLKNGVVKYALLPVWLLNTTWNGTQYVFAMNGQTGKFVGNLPIDKGLCFKQWLRGFLFSLPVGALIGYVISLFL